jgi:hypothetical protein
MVIAYQGKVDWLDPSLDIHTSTECLSVERGSGGEECAVDSPLERSIFGAGWGRGPRARSAEYTYNMQRTECYRSGLAKQRTICACAGRCMRPTVRENLTLQSDKNHVFRGESGAEPTLFPSVGPERGNRAQKSRNAFSSTEVCEPQAAQTPW